MREDHKVTLALSQVHNLRLSNLTALQGLCKYSSHSRNRQRLFQFLPKKIEDEKNIINVKNQKKARKPRAKATKGSPEFEAFWKRYQACQHLVQSQPKGAALEQWKQIVPDEVSADDLMRAIEAADQESQRRSTPDWEQRLPMCSRWLKEGYYCTYLEEKQPQERKPSWML